MTSSDSRANARVGCAWLAPERREALADGGADRNRRVWVDVFAVRQWPGNDRDRNNCLGVMDRCDATIVAVDPTGRLARPPRLMLDACGEWGEDGRHEMHGHVWGKNGVFTMPRPIYYADSMCTRLHFLCRNQFFIRKLRHWFFIRWKRLTFFSII
mgnify:CR=1 FL=1